CYVHGEDVAAAATSREQRFLARQVLRRAACVIANSHNTERILLDEWDLPVERVRVLHPGVDTERFVPAARDYGVRGRLGWGERARVIGPCGGPQERSRVLAGLLGEPELLGRMGAAGRGWVVHRFDWSGLGRQAVRLLSGETADPARAAGAAGVEAVV